LDRSLPVCPCVSDSGRCVKHPTAGAVTGVVLGKVPGLKHKARCADERENCQSLIDRILDITGIPEHSWNQG
jgi:hypothetical protein